MSNANEVSLLESVGADVPGGYHRCGLGEGYPLAFVSKSFLDTVGYTKEQLKNEKNNCFLELVAPEDKEFFLSHATELEEKGHVSLNYRIVRRDGSYRWVQDNTKHTVIDGEDFYQCTLADITAYVEKMSKITASGGELIAIASKEQILSEITRMIYGYNVTLNLRTGKYSLIEGTGMQEFTEIYHYTDDFEESCKFKLERMSPEFKKAYIELVSLDSLRKQKDRNGHIGTMQYSVNVDGEVRWHEIHVFMGMDGYGERIVNILCKDISEIKEESNIKNQLEIAKASNEAKTRFLSNMSHDIRTPINGIMGMLHIAKSHRGDTERVDDCLNKIEISANYLLTLLNDILDLNKLESGKMLLEENPFDMNELIDDIYNIIQPSAQMSGITVEKKQNDFKHSEVIGSATHLRQILMNLTSNAVKYSNEKGTVYVRTEELDREGDIVWYQFSVKDNGVGMTKEFQQKMFDMFEQEQSDARTTHKGSGLGLAIVKMLVDLFGGKLKVESEKGKGSLFTVTLPFKINHNPLPIEKKGIIDTKDCLKDIRILVVEDNEFNMEIAQEILQDAGAIITQAEHGRTAVEIFEAAPENAFDIILMDVMMPEMDGLEATKIIRAMNRTDAKKIPIIAMTANAFSEDVKKSLEAGMNEHIAKPLDMKILATTVAKLLNEIGDE